MNLIKTIVYPVYYIVQKCRECMEMVLRMLRMIAKPAPAVHADAPDNSSQSVPRGLPRRSYTWDEIAREINTYDPEFPVPPEGMRLKYIDPECMEPYMFKFAAEETAKANEEHEQVTAELELPAPEPIALPWHEAISNETGSEEEATLDKHSQEQHDEQDKPSSENEQEEALETTKPIKEDQPALRNDQNNNTARKSKYDTVYRRRPKTYGQSRSADCSQTRNQKDATTKTAMKPAAKVVQRPAFVNKRWNY